MMRAIDVGAVIGDTIAVVRRHFSVFATVAAAFYLVPSIAVGLLFPLAGRAPDPAHPTHLPPAFWLATFALALIALVASFTIAAIAADPAEGGGRTLGATIAGVLPRIAKAIVVGLLLAIAYLIVCIAVGFVLVVVGVIVALAAGSGGAKAPTADPALAMTIAGAIFVLVLPLFLWLYGRLTPLLGVILREELSPSDSIRRAWALSRGQGWRIAGLQLVVIVPELAVQILAWIVLRNAGAVPGDALSVAVLVVRTAIVAWLLLYHYAGMAIVYRRLAEA